MREIKFRQACFHNGKFHHFHYWGFISGAFVGVDTGYTSLEHAHNNSQQFTGLRDKAGVEIYEGDILCLNGDERFVEKIWFDDKAAMFCFGDLSVFEFFQVTDESEVIGNIYENPELLEAK